MDELEISGKRYISSRRAAREHKYHRDYIGQLIRSDKVVGQKVGRTWYVDAHSLAVYLNKETTLPVEYTEIVEEQFVKEEDKSVSENISEKVQLTYVVEEEQRSGVVEEIVPTTHIEVLLENKEKDQVIVTTIPNQLKNKTYRALHPRVVVFLTTLGILSFLFVTGISYFFVYQQSIGVEGGTSGISISAIRY